MPRRPIFITSVMLAAFAWAQDPPAAPGETAAEKAAKAMAAMEALSENAASSGETSPVEPPAPEAGTEASPARNAKTASALPPLLPGAGTEGTRGMDVLSRTRLDMMVPAGRSHRGVHYPMFRPVETDRAVLDPVQGSIAGVTAPMASLFESDLVTRLDDDHVQFDRAKFIQYDEKPAADGSNRPTMKLEIERGVYDLKNEILMTNQPVRIETPQFVIEGDTMLHDRASQLTRFTRAKMTFFNEEPAPAPALSTTSPANPPAPAPAPSVPAAAPVR